MSNERDKICYCRREEASAVCVCVCVQTYLTGEPVTSVGLECVGGDFKQARAWNELQSLVAAPAYFFPIISPPNDTTINVYS